MAVAADQQVVHHAGMFEHRQVLEGPTDADGGQAVCRHAGDVAAIEMHGAAAGLDDAADHVEGGRLAGPVGADQGIDFTAPNVKTDTGNGFDAAEALGQGFDP